MGHPIGDDHVVANAQGIRAGREDHVAHSSLEQLVGDSIGALKWLLSLSGFHAQPAVLRCKPRAELAARLAAGRAVVGAASQGATFGVKAMLRSL